MPRRTESRELDTTACIVAALDGLKSVSDLTGAPYKTVWGWTQDNRFPSRFFLLMSFALYRKGLAARPELWGQVTPSARRQALKAVVALEKERAA
jgi:hypothetical protein